MCPIYFLSTKAIIEPTRSEKRTGLLLVSDPNPKIFVFHSSSTLCTRSRVSENEATFMSATPCTLDYLINAHCVFIYFQEKSYPVRPYSIVVNSTMTALCVYLFLEKYPALCAYSILCDY